MRVVVQGGIRAPGWANWNFSSSQVQRVFHRNPRSDGFCSSRKIVAESSTSRSGTAKMRRKNKQQVDSARLVGLSSDGRLISSTKTYQKDYVQICIEVESSEDLDVLWGVYRASPDAWQFPKAIEVMDSTMDDDIGAMCTPMLRQEDGIYVTTFKIPEKLSPVTFAYALRTNCGAMLTPLSGGHFTVPIGIEPGSAKSIGPQMYQDKITLAVECRGAEYVSVVLVLEGKEGEYTVQDFALDPSLNRMGAIWHASMKPQNNIVGYGWRVNGDLSWEQGYRISPDAVLLDPEATNIVFVEPCESLAAFPHVRSRDGRTVVALSSFSSRKTFNKSRSKADTGMQGYGMLSLDPQTFGLGMAHVDHPGTFLGIAEASQYFASLGIKSVVLRKPYVLDMTDNRSVTYFAPDPMLASSPADVEVEFQDMVDCLHAAGIQVLLTIDLTLTAEGSDDHPNPISWRGLDNASYYRANGVLNCGNPVMQEHIIRALRHWTWNLGVDGFEFLYAENMIQNIDEVVMDAPALPDALCHDPILSGSILIASPHTFDLLPRHGERGFPHWGRWRESNGDKGVILQYFLAPPASRDPASLKVTAAAVAGRPHLFSPAFHGFPGNLSSKRPIGFSINDVDSSGWTDSVISTAASAARAVMLADGHHDDIPTSTSITRAIIAATIFSSGTPSIPIEALSEETEGFIRNCFTCRPILADILDSGSVGTWHSISGHAISLDVASVDTFYIGRYVSSHAGSVYIAMNPECHPLTVSLPSVSSIWKCVIDSYTGNVVHAGQPISGTSFTIPAKSFALLIA